MALVSQWQRRTRGLARARLARSMRLTKMDDMKHPKLDVCLQFKVGNMGTMISETKLMDKWAASKRTQVSAILCIKLLPLLENALKLNFKALYETENLDPLQGPTHTLTSSSIHTQNRPKNYGWIYHLLSSVAGYSPKLTAALKNRGLATLGFQKKFHTHQLKPTQAKASFHKVNLPPAKL